VRAEKILSVLVLAPRAVASAFRSRSSRIHFCVKALTGMPHLNDFVEMFVTSLNPGIFKLTRVQVSDMLIVLAGS